MRIRPRSRPLAMPFLVVAMAACACGDPPTPEASDPAAAPYDVGSAADREALLEDIIAKTMLREAISPVKNARLGLDVEAAMRAHRDLFVDADTPEKLFYALIELSNARKDRHLSVDPTEGGIELESWESPAEAPVRFAVDYGTPGEYFVFVADVGSGHREEANIGDGDRLLAVNDMPFDEYVEAIEPFVRHSTIDGFWWKMAEGLSLKDNNVPPRFYDAGAGGVAEVRYRLQAADGNEYTAVLPYLELESITWPGRREYPGFELVRDLETFDLYVHESQPVILLDWYGFREFLVQDVDWLVEHAEAEGLLDHAVIFDATRSRGGSLGAYAIQRLSPMPFKTTFGNLKISDITREFIDDKRRQFEARAVNDSGSPETIDDGAWLMDWLETDVSEALTRGAEYSNNVPFKLAHAPKDSDGTLQPAPVHFRGDLVVLLGPHGGSHLDQFASIVVDNDLGHVIGMPAGGYSNTWEWEEVLLSPTTEQPIASFMWSIGHTIRPNGEILEGNPAEVDEFVPQTRDNYPRYYALLLERAFEYLGYE